MSNNSNTENNGEGSYFEIRPYKFSELAKLYNVQIRTLKKWLTHVWHRLGKILGHYLSISQVEIIVAHLGVPYKIKVEQTDEDNSKPLKEAKTKSLQPEQNKNVSKQIPNNHNERKEILKAKTNRIKSHKDRLNKKRNRKK